MSEVSERLRQARIERGESLDLVIRRSGVRAAAAQAIEEGRFKDLPSGIYGRATVRRYCAALGLDPEPVLAVCGPLLPAVEDPIAALARMQGLPLSRPRRGSEDTTSKTDQEIGDASGAKGSGDALWGVPSWGLLAGAAMDAFVIVAMLLAVVTCTVAAGVPVSAFGNGSAAAFTVIAFVLGSSYFVVLGGVAGTTLGQQLAGVRVHPGEAAALDLRTITARTVRCVFRDALFIESAGAWIGRWTADRRWPIRATDQVEDPAGS